MQVKVEQVGGYNHCITVENTEEKWLQLVIGRPNAERTSIELGLTRPKAFALAGALITVGSQIKD